MKYKYIPTLALSSYLRGCYHLRYFSFIILLFCQNATLALTYDEYQEQFQSYLNQVPEGLQAQAQNNYTLFASLLLSCHSFLSNKDEELLANEILHQVLQRIASHAHESSWEIYHFLRKRLQSHLPDSVLPPPTTEHTVTFPSLSPDKPYSTALLQAIARLSLNPGNARIRLVMNDSRAWQRQFYQLYRQGGGIQAGTWHFLMQEGYFRLLLEQLDLPEEIIQRILSSSSYSVLSSDNYEDVKSDEYELLRFSLHHENGLRCLNIRQFVFQPEKNVNRQVMSVDICFSKQPLPDHQYLPWESIGWIPVVSPRAMFDEALAAFTTGSYRAGNFLTYLYIWKHLEEASPQLQSLPEVFSYLEGFDPHSVNIPEEPVSTAIVEIPVLLPEADLVLPESNLPLSPMPLFPSQMTETDKKSAQQQKLRDSINQSRQRCVGRYQTSKEEFRKNMVDLKLITWSKQDVSGEESVDVLHKRLEELYCIAEELRKQYRYNLQSFFLTHFDRYCEKGCHACKALKGTYFTLLGELFLCLAQDFNIVFLTIQLRHHSPLMISIAARAKAMVTGLKMTAKAHEEDAHMIKEKHHLDCSLAHRGDLKVPDILPDLTALYEFLYEQYQQLRTQNQVQASEFLDGILEWREQLLFINQHAANFRPGNRDALLKYIILKLQVIGLLVNDLAALSECLPDDLKCLKQCLSGATSLPCPDKLTTALNNAIQTMLANGAGYSDLYDEPSVNTEQLETLLQAIQELPLLNDACQQTLTNISTERSKTKESLKQLKEEARLMAEQLARELTEKEEALRAARSKLRERVNPKKTGNSKRQKKKNKKTSTASLTQKSAAKEPPLPPARWEILLNEARTSIASEEYKDAIKKLKEVIKAAPQQETPLIRIDLADTSLLSTEERRSGIKHLQNAISLYHISYKQSLEESDYRVRLVSREKLFNTASQFEEAWKDLEDDMKQALTYHQEALKALRVRPDLIEADFYRDLLHRSLEVITTFNQQVIESRSQLLATYKFRKQKFSKSIQNPTAGSIKPLGIPKMLKRIERQQNRHIEYWKESGALAEQAKVRIIPLSAYQRFSVLPDGDCFFSALAIAMNNLQGKSDWSAQKVREKIHNILSRIIYFIDQSPVKKQTSFQQGLSNLLGIDFDSLQVMVEQNILTQSAQKALSTASSLQQYGQINLLLLLQLTEDIPAGIHLPDTQELQSYNAALWLTLAPDLLAEMVHAGEFNVGHWSENLQQALQQDDYVTGSMYHEIENTPITTILSHSSHSSPVFHHFDVSVLTPREVINKMVKAMITVSMIFLLKTSLAQAQMTHIKK